MQVQNNLEPQVHMTRKNSSISNKCSNAKTKEQRTKYLELQEENSNSNAKGNTRVTLCLSAETLKVKKA
jgi:hypothetical protein